jgi:hypothetical protein
MGTLISKNRKLLKERFEKITGGTETVIEFAKGY